MMHVSLYESNVDPALAVFINSSWRVVVAIAAFEALDAL
jgi:hypothetical protein